MMYAMSTHGLGGGIFELGADLRNLDVEEVIATIAHRAAPLPNIVSTPAYDRQREIGPIGGLGQFAKRLAIISP
jgi:hypothetical protein